MRKAILLAMAAAIVAMFRDSGLGFGGLDKHHVANANNAELEIDRNRHLLRTEVGGWTCTSTNSRVDFEVGTTGKITSFASENTGGNNITSNCQGRGLIAQCEVHEATADNLPWTIHTATGTTMSVTIGTITFTITGFFCPHTLSLTPGTVTMTVFFNPSAKPQVQEEEKEAQRTTTSTATLSGNLLTDGDLGNGIATTVSGTVHVLGTITYGI